MFKKIYEKIADLKQYIRNLHDIQCNNNDDSARRILSATSSILSKLETTKRHEATIESQQRTIESQQRTIEQLTNALKDKYEHGLFIFSEDCKIPTVIRNGKELTNKLTSYFSIDWEFGSAPNITIEQFAGTSHDMEE